MHPLRRSSISGPKPHQALGTTHLLQSRCSADLSVCGVLQRAVHDLGEVVRHPHEEVHEVRVVQVLRDLLQMGHQLGRHAQSTVLRRDGDSCDQQCTELVSVMDSDTVKLAVTAPVT